MATQAELSRAGIVISPEQFNELTRQATERLQRAGYVTSPALELTKEETAALIEGGLDLSPLEYGENDPVALSTAEYVALIDTSLSVDQVAQLLSVDTSRVRQRLGERSLYGIKVKGRWRIPTFQFEGNSVLPGFSEVVPMLDPGLHPLSIFRWFTFPCVDLEIDDMSVSPRDWLRSGGDPAIVGAWADALSHSW